MSHRFLQKQAKKILPHGTEDRFTLSIEEVQRDEIDDVIERIAPSRCRICGSDVIEHEHGTFIEGYCPGCAKTLWIINLPGQRLRPSPSEWVDMAWSLDER